MANGKCKTKACDNPVLDGKYCEYCTQKRKEKRDAGLVIVGTALIGLIGVAIKKGGLKQVPKIAAKAVKIIFRA